MTNENHANQNGEPKHLLENESTNQVVGYRNPPKKGQFRKGQSGNPKGRPKGQRNLAKVLRRLVNEPITVRDGGRERIMTKGDAALLALVHRALGGDPRAMGKLIELMKATGEFKIEGPEVVGGVLRVDRPILTTEEFKKRWGPDSLNTIPKVDAYQKQMIEACELMRKEIREREAWHAKLRERYGHLHGIDPK